MAKKLKDYFPLIQSRQEVLYRDAGDENFI